MARILILRDVHPYLHDPAMDGQGPVGGRIHGKLVQGKPDMQRGRWRQIDFRAGQVDLAHTLRCIPLDLGGHQHRQAGAAPIRVGHDILRGRQ